jgi:hypothetical protein
MPPKRKPKKRTRRGDIDQGDFIYKLYSKAAESGMSGLDLIMNIERTILKLYKKDDKVKYRIQDQQYNIVKKEEFYNTTFQNIINNIN